MYLPKAMQEWCQEEDGFANPRLLHSKKCNRYSAFAKVGGGQVRDETIRAYCKDVIKKKANVWHTSPGGKRRRNAACDCIDPEGVPNGQPIKFYQKLYNQLALSGIN